MKFIFFGKDNCAGGTASVTADTEVLATKLLLAYSPHYKWERVFPIVEVVVEPIKVIRPIHRAAVGGLLCPDCKRDWQLHRKPRCPTPIHEDLP